MQEAEPLESVGQNEVRWRGRVFTYFGGCDYFRLARHPRIQAAVKRGLTEYGLSMAASRMTTGNHPLYLELERTLARWLGATDAVLTNSGYVTNLIVAQALAGKFSHAFLDERAHAALTDAAVFLNCPVRQFRHRDPGDLAAALRQCGAPVRPVVLTDGMFSHNGSVAPLSDYLTLLPPDGLLIVDDSHGVGILGDHGRGTIEFAGVKRRQIIQTITLSKALGTYGGAILATKQLRSLLTQTRLFAGSTPLPLPLAQAALTSIGLQQGNPARRTRLQKNTEYLTTGLQDIGFNLVAQTGPIIPIRFPQNAINQRVKAALRKAGILPPFLQYFSGPNGGYFRFVISSQHTTGQLDGLISALRPFAKLARN